MRDREPQPVAPRGSHSIDPETEGAASAGPCGSRRPNTKLHRRECAGAGADGGTRTRTGFPPRDFKSLASTIPPRPRAEGLALAAGAAEARGPRGALTDHRSFGRSRGCKAARRAAAPLAAVVARP